MGTDAGTAVMPHVLVEPVATGTSAELVMRMERTLDAHVPAGLLEVRPY